MARIWTNAESDELIRLIALGLTSRQIAKKMHRSIDSIKSHRRRLGEAQRLTPRVHGDTLCWKCRHSSGKYGFCSWFVYGHETPVSGWDALPSFLRQNGEATRRSYLVRACPQFEQEERA